MALALFGFLVSGLGGLDLIVEEAEVVGLAVVLDGGLPLVTVGVDAFEAGASPLA